MRSATRANLPSRYAFSLVKPPPPNTPTASRPCAICISRIVVSAASQLTGSSGAPFAARISGVVSRSGTASSSADVHPLRHSPPLLVGKSRAATLHAPSAGTSVIPHCIAQYGQCVSVPAGGAAIYATYTRAAVTPTAPHVVRHRFFTRVSPISASAASAANTSSPS